MHRLIAWTVVGLAALNLGATSVTLTDLKEAQSHIEETIGLIPEYDRSRINFRDLNWFNPSIFPTSYYDVILGSRLSCNPWSSALSVCLSPIGKLTMTDT